MLPHNGQFLRPTLPILGLILTACLIATNYAQTNCVQPPFGYLSESWAPGTEVTVNIDPRYNEQQREDIKAVFDNWGAALASQSNVKFINFTNNPVDESTDTTPKTVNVIRISGRSTGQVRLTPGTNGRLSGANIFVPECKTENRTNSNILKGAVAHEVGHTFGLENCSSCSPGQSIMGVGVQSVAGDICSAVWPDPDNPGGYLSGPRPCDVQATAYGYPTPTTGGPQEPCYVTGTCPEPSDNGGGGPPGRPSWWTPPATASPSPTRRAASASTSTVMAYPSA